MPELDYPFHDTTVTVTHRGKICFKSKKINLSLSLSGQPVGITEVQDNIWLVSFMVYDLGYFDVETWKFTPANNPFGAKVLPMSSVRTQLPANS